jgi:hypothetical protein
MKLHITYITIITAMAMAIFFLLDRWNKSKQKTHEQEQILTEKQDSIRYHKNKYDQVVSEKKSADITTKEFKDYYKAETQKLKDQLGITAKDLRAYMDAKFTTIGKGNTTVVHNHYIDSTGRAQDSTSLQISDGYLALRASISDSTRMAKYLYTYSDSMTFAISVKKKWFLGNETLYGSGVFGNPNTKITHSTSVLIKDYRDKRWVVSAGVSYNPFMNQFVPAVHFGYALIKF